jgi:ATP-dependent RNA circularization protein (DNA/RNA ligase family)
MKKISYHICSDASLCGVLRTGIKDLQSAWVILGELQKKWPEAMIQEVEETPRGGHIYNVIEITVKKTPYAEYIQSYFKKRK